MIYGDRTKEHRNQHGRDGKDIKKKAPEDSEA